MDDSRSALPVRSVESLEPNQTTDQISAHASSQRLLQDVIGGGISNIKPRAELPSQIDPREAHPSAYSIIPPYLLEDLAKRNPSFLPHKTTLDQIQNLPIEFHNQLVFANGGDSAREVFDANGKQTHPGTKVRFEGEGPSGNKEADDAYDFTGQVRSFYKEVYGRNSIDDKGMKFISTVNYGENFENAFWDGKQMTYGHPGKDSPFATFMLLDVCGHEITHGVTQKEANFIYWGQSGALNESVSDVFGELIKQRSTNTLAKDAHWLVGEGIWKSNIHARGLRDMLHPGTAYDDPKIGKDPQPDNMKNYVRTFKDNGGVHLNSGIPNRAFAEFATSVGGYAWEEPGKIWYEARHESGSLPSFASFAYHTIEAAKKLGYTADVAKLEKAWADVGVKPSAHGWELTTPPASGAPADTNPSPESASVSRLDVQDKTRNVA